MIAFDKLRSLQDDPNVQEDRARKQDTNQLVASSDLEKRLIEAVELIETVKNDTETMRLVLLPNLSESIGEAFWVAQSNHQLLADLCNTVIGNSIMLQAIDTAIESELPLLKEEINVCMASIRESASLSQEERATFLAELGRIVKLSSAGKIVASIPLIPGFLKYTVDGTVSIDWNKWFGKLRSVFRHSD